MLRAGWVNFFFLPEVINREWAGRGLLAWANHHLVMPLRRRSADPATAAACVPVTLQVLTCLAAHCMPKLVCMVVPLALGDLLIKPQCDCYPVS